MIATRRVHLVVVAVTASVMLFGFGLGSAALAQSSEEQPTQRVIPAGSVTLQTIPSSVPETGGEVELAAIVRDDRGRPLENAKVNFLTETGTLGSGGRLLTTGAAGGVTDRLTLTAAELAAVGENSFQLAVAVGSDGVALRTANTSVGIQRLPQAAFKYSPGGLLVAFRDTSAGQVTSRLWDFGDGATSTRQSPSHRFAKPGYYAVTLRAENPVGANEVTRLVRVGRGPDTSE